MRLLFPRTCPGRPGRCGCRAAPIPFEGSVQMEGKEQFHLAYVLRPEVETQKQTPALAPEFCASSSWQQSAFFSCFSLDLVVGKVAAQFFRGRCVSFVGALVKQHKTDQ